MTRQSVIEWASSWVPDNPPGQKQRFAEALEVELKTWREPEEKPVFCKNCPHASFLHPTPFCANFEPTEGP